MNALAPRLCPCYSLNVGFIGNILIGVAIQFLLWTPFFVCNLAEMKSARDTILPMPLILMIFCYVSTIITAYFFYRFGIGGLRAFVPPVSFFVFPFVLYPVLYGLRKIINIPVDPAGWEIAAFSIGIIYSLPLAIITGILSCVLNQSK